MILADFRVLPGARAVTGLNRTPARVALYASRNTIDAIGEASNRRANIAAGHVVGPGSVHAVLKYRIAEASRGCCLDFADDSVRAVTRIETTAANAAVAARLNGEFGTAAAAIGRRGSLGAKLAVAVLNPVAEVSVVALRVRRATDLA